MEECLKDAVEYKNKFGNPENKNGKRIRPSTIAEIIQEIFKKNGKNQ